MSDQTSVKDQTSANPYVVNVPGNGDYDITRY